MRFTLTAVLAAVATVVLAQSPNAFNVPTAGYLLHAGEPTTFTWSDKQGSTVTLTLRDGSNGDLNQGTIITAGLTNTGSYTWNVPSTIVEGNSYTIEISDDDDPSATNFTPQFDILSSVLASSVASGSSSSTVASSSGASSSAAASTSGSSSSAVSSSAASTSAAASSGSSTGGSTSTAAASTSSPTSDSANMLRVGGGSLLAVAFGFAVAL